MPRQDGGEQFPLDREQDILEINSPLDRVQGPYVVVYRSEACRWAMVALYWDGNPALGTRFFYGTRGEPNSSGYAMWHILPSFADETILDRLVREELLSPERRTLLTGFFNCEITGRDLATSW